MISISIFPRHFLIVMIFIYELIFFKFFVNYDVTIKMLNEKVLNEVSSNLIAIEIYSYI